MATHTTPPKRIGFSRNLSRWDVKISPYLYVSPFFASFAIFGLVPIVFNVVVATHNWHRRFGQGDFVGLDNFRWVLEQPAFWISLQNTFAIFLLSTIPQIIVALWIAAMLDQNLRAKTFWRMGVLIPFVVMPVATSMIFGFIFGRFGMVTPLLHDMGLFTDYSSPFFQDRFLSHVAIATMVTFRWTGYNALIFLAAMQAVPRELYESATLDGCGRLRQFFSITIPSIRATMIFVTLMMTIGGLQIFDEPRMYDGTGSGGTGAGGPDNQWLTTVLYLFNLGFGDWQDRLGQAAAVAWLFAVVILVFTLANFALTRRIASSKSKQSPVARATTRRLIAEARAAGEASARAAREAGVPTLIGVTSSSSPRPSGKEEGGARR